jgi:SAM-dependent methyltransferase
LLSSGQPCAHEIARQQVCFLLNTICRLQITPSAVRIFSMEGLYQRDLAYIHATAFGAFAESAAREVVRRLRGSNTWVRRVLEVGCGAGPLTKALTDAGFDVVAVDVSAALLEMARAHAPMARFIHGSVYNIEIRDFDAVVAVGESLTYHAEPAEADPRLSRFFQQVAGSVPLGGMLIFDVIGLGQPSLAGRTWRSGDDWAVLTETTESQNERTLVRHIESFRRVGDLYRRSLEIHKVRLFDIGGLCDELASQGFATEITQCYGANPLPPRRHALFATRI